MLGKAMLQKLYDHSYWVTERILSSAEKLTMADYTSPTEFSEHSLRDILVHTFYYDWSWRHRSQGQMPAVDSFSPEDYPDVTTLKTAWQAEEAIMQTYLDTLSEADLQRAVTVGHPSGAEYQLVQWHMLTHVTTHGMQHRSEAAMILTHLGQSPSSLDLITFLYAR